LGRLEGVVEARVGANKFLYDVKVKETKSLLPADFLAVAKKLEEYPFAGMVITSISGTAEKSGEDYVLTARGSNQKYTLKPNDDLKKLVGAGKAKVTLAGKVTQDKAKVTIEVTEAKEAK
jgi:hypothetical protein